MIHLRNRTEYSFRTAVGRLSEVLTAQDESKHWAGIADRHGTWGHVRWAKACAAVEIRPVFGVELAVVSDVSKDRERLPINYMSFFARTNAGLREIYELMTVATEKQFYVPRIDYHMLWDLNPDNVIILSGLFPDWHQLSKGLKSFYIELNQLSSPAVIAKARETGYPFVATQDNLYPRAGDLALYQVIMGEKLAQMRTAPAYILQEWEWRQLIYEKGIKEKEATKAIQQAYKIAQTCCATLPTATMVHPVVSKTLEQLCTEGAKKRGINLNSDPVYAARTKKELALIHEKKFEDYFFVVEDMITYAKKHMFVGPARGSSCGSLVCYLLGITDIDPIPYGLLFERFIDVNREDYPDIDIDFQDDKREMVFDYLKEKYGYENVARLGTIAVFKAKSALTVTAKELKVPLWEITDLKNSIIERSTGDARATFCVADTFEQLELGREMLKKYPELKLSSRLEGHASHTGMHSAGIVITADEVINYCSINKHTSNVMLDKFDAEKLSLLKIDALGLRTLTVFADTLAQINWTRSKLKDWPKDDEKAFAILNENKFAGIFQFEGIAVQSVTKQMHGVKSFEDIAHITALARPGPFRSGGTGEFIKRRNGDSVVKYLHPLAKDITKLTYGVIIYQEQVMQIARTIGALSWEDVSELRKAMSKSLGKEFFDKYWKKFWAGAKAKSIHQEDARHIWDSINTMGSWAFNRSHAIAYGTMSYWCCVLKSYHPLEFAAACLRNAKDNDQSIKILRELVNEGYQYKPFDPLLSGMNWTVGEGQLIGGLMGIVGVGPKLAENIIRKRNTQTAASKDRIPFTKRELLLLNNGVTPWDHVFEARDRWGHIFDKPSRYGITSKLTRLSEIKQNDEGEFVFIAKMMKKDMRDHNGINELLRRDGRRMPEPSLYLFVTVEDDTDNIICLIDRWKYEALGLPIINEEKVGDWFLWKGTISKGFHRIKLERFRRLSGVKKYDVTNIKAPVRLTSRSNTAGAGKTRMGARKTKSLRISH
jgi:DNA-directed DNA polymerase III PolC